MPRPAATIFYGGPIITMDDRRPNAQAVVIAGSKVLFVGTLDEAKRVAGPRAKKMNLDGRTLMPGLIDPHQHPVPGGIMLTHMTGVGYDVYKTKADVLAALKAKVARTPAGAWIYADNYDNVLQGGDLSMAELDGVSTDHPIFVYYISMHSATANSAAFKLAGITASTGELPGGGHFGKNADGTLNGMLYEPPALEKFTIGLPKLTMELIGQSVKKFLYQSAALGITMVHEAGAYAPTPGALEGYKAIMANSPVRYSASPAVEFLDVANKFVAAYGKPGAKALEVPGTFLSFYAVKIVSDGSPQQETAFQSQPYLHTTSKGLPNYTATELNSLVVKIKESGWPVSIHCNGDASLERALDAIEAAYGPTPPPTGINRIEHCTLANADQIARMKRMNVQPSHLMNNVYYYGAAYRDQIFGAERANRFNPAGDFLAAGIPFSVHSDCPCSPIAPLREISTAVTRICSVDGSVVGENVRVPLEAGLKSMTTVAAAHCGLGDKAGSLTINKYADLAILESNPLKVDPAKLGDIKVSETWVNGAKVTIPAS
ncbi:MAG TPA: amidohydrolase [Candidatus Baltobacteraceae bacterium]|nr:amidohydrolase [Candidatus Baltobacteraceae bacterium]